MKVPILVAALCFIATVYCQPACFATNPANQLTYNLTRMIMSPTQPDYFITVNDGSQYASYFVNICAPTKEPCTNAAVCEQNLMTEPPVADSLGGVTGFTFTSYTPNSTADGISLVYIGGDSCGEDSTYTTTVNVACDLSVTYGVIDSINTENTCSVVVNMRSKYGCGYDPEEGPIPCSDYVSNQTSCTYFGQNNFNCTAGPFSIEVTGNQNVPKYSFYVESNYTNSDSSDDTPYGGSYAVQFQEIWETDADGNKTPGSTISLPSLNWNFTVPAVIVYDDDDCTTETTFNITNIVQSGEKYWDNLVFINHLTNSSTSLKFDVWIENYKWQSPDSTNLVISVLLHSDQNDADGPANDTYSSVGNAFFSVSPTAMAFADTSDPSNYVDVNVTLVTSGGSQNIEIVYGYFTGSLLHDPTMGVNPLTPPPAPAAPCDSGIDCSFDTFSIDQYSATDDFVGIDIWLNSDSDQVSSMVFSYINEVQYTGSDAESLQEIEFDSIAWTFSDPETFIPISGEPQLGFSISAGITDYWDSFTISCTVSMVNGISHLDLQVEINNFNWKSNDSLLNFGIDIASPGDISYAYDLVQIGTTYFANPDLYGSAATVSTVQIVPTTLSYEEEIIVTISNFQGTFSSNPFTFGISTSTDPAYTSSVTLQDVSGDAVIDDSGNMNWAIWVGIAAGSLVLVAAVIFVVIGFVIVKNKRKNSYTQVE